MLHYREPEDTWRDKLMGKKKSYRKAKNKSELKLNKPRKSWRKDKTLVVLTERPNGRKWVHHYDPWWVLYPEKAKSAKDLKEMVEEGEVDYNEPVQSWLDNKKLVVLAKKGKKTKVVHFGHPDYEDYTMHGDPVRRKDYLKRSGGIRNKEGKLTRNDKFSSNHWAREILW